MMKNKNAVYWKEVENLEKIDDVFYLALMAADGLRKFCCLQATKKKNMEINSNEVVKKVTVKQRQKN